MAQSYEAINKQIKRLKKDQNISDKAIDAIYDTLMELIKQKNINIVKQCAKDEGRNLHAALSVIDINS